MRGAAGLLVFWSMKESIATKEGGDVQVYLYSVRGREKLCSSVTLVRVVSTEWTLHGLIFSLSCKSNSPVATS